MVSRKLVGVMAAALVLAFAGATGHAWPGTRSTLTFSGAVALPNGVINPGTYVFEVVNPMTGGDVVCVRTNYRVYYMGFTNRVDRTLSRGQSGMVTLGESGPGMAPPILAWYPLGDDRGYEFVYR